MVIRDGAYVFVNDAWAELLARTADEFDGRAVKEDLDPDMRRRLESWLHASGEPLSAEFSFVRADGSIAILHLSRVQDDAGLLGFTARDLTLIKRLQARQLTADRMMSVGALAAGVAHEINNPLSYVLGNLTYLLEECASIDANVPAERRQDIKEALTEALEGAERVRGIVGGLQSFARADRETLKAVDVNEALTTAINMAWIEIRHRAKLVKNINEVAEVRANEATLGQVFLNFLLNASYALPVGKARDNEIRVSCHEEQDQVVVVISDTGPGIPPDVVNHVFDTFFTKPRPGIGSALALSISHTIIADLGGTIEVNSSHAGTSFKVMLPIFQEDDVEPEERVESGLREPGARRILVIDDVEPVTKSVQRALRGHEVYRLHSGREAIALLTADSDFDIIFCDILMGELSGIDVYRWVKENRPGLERNMVFMTGDIYGKEVTSFLRGLKNDRLSKPFELTALRRYVAEYRPKSPR